MAKSWESRLLRFIHNSRICHICSSTERILKVMLHSLSGVLVSSYCSVCNQDWGNLKLLAWVHDPSTTWGFRITIFQGNAWQRKHIHLLLQIFIEKKVWMRCDFKWHSWWHWHLVLEICKNVYLEDWSCWPLFSSMTNYTLVAYSQCWAWHSSAHGDCSAWPEQNKWFVFTKYVERLAQNLSIVIQLARFTCPFW